MSVLPATGIITISNINTLLGEVFNFTRTLSSTRNVIDGVPTTGTIFLGNMRGKGRVIAIPSSANAVRVFLARSHTGGSTGSWQSIINTGSLTPNTSSLFISDGNNSYWRVSGSTSTFTNTIGLPNIQQITVGVVFRDLRAPSGSFNRLWGCQNDTLEFAISSTGRINIHTTESGWIDTGINYSTSWSTIILSRTINASTNNLKLWINGTSVFIRNIASGTSTISSIRLASRLIGGETINGDVAAFAVYQNIFMTDTQATDLHTYLKSNTGTLVP